MTSDEERAQFIRLYAAGCSIHQIGKMFRRSAEGIRYQLIKAGITLRRKKPI